MVQPITATEDVATMSTLKPSLLVHSTDVAIVEDSMHRVSVQHMEHSVLIVVNGDIFPVFAGQGSKPNRDASLHHAGAGASTLNQSNVYIWAKACVTTFLH